MGEQTRGGKGVGSARQGRKEGSRCVVPCNMHVERGRAMAGAVAGAMGLLHSEGGDGVVASAACKGGCSGNNNSMQRGMQWQQQ